MKRAYKVVRRLGNNVLRSSDLPHSLAFTYKRREWQEPKIKGSKFFVYEDVLEAHRHAKSNDHVCEVWEVAVTELQRVGDFQERFPSLWQDWWRKIDKKNLLAALEDFWLGKQSNLDSGKPTSSARLTPKIKLLKKIPQKDTSKKLCGIKNP